jgi:hypothetical protein
MQVAASITRPQCGHGLGGRVASLIGFSYAQMSSFVPDPRWSSNFGVSGFASGVLIAMTIIPKMMPAQKTATV